jgi:hypothetical protein
MFRVLQEVRPFSGQAEAHAQANLLPFSPFARCRCGPNWVLILPSPKQGRRIESSEVYLIESLQIQEREFVRLKVELAGLKPEVAGLKPEVVRLQTEVWHPEVR